MKFFAFSCLFILLIVKNASAASFECDVNNKKILFTKVQETQETFSTVEKVKDLTYTYFLNLKDNKEYNNYLKVSNNKYTMTYPMSCAKI